MSLASPRSKPLPKLPLPPKLLSNEPGTWAYDTMSRRVREEILGREVIGANAELLSKPEWAKARASLEALNAELEAPGTTVLRYLTDDVAPDSAAWREILRPYVEGGNTWLDAPWCVTEFYLYRRVMESLGFFTEPEQFLDPFLASKRKGLASSLGSMEALAPKVLAALRPGEDVPLDAGLRLFALISLWGNRMDLSLWPAGTDGNVADAFAEVLAAGEANLLHDDFSDLLGVAQECKAAGGKRVDIIVDNAGFELVTDLCLADYLVTSGVASEVVFQLKAHPTFVSDARAVDLKEHVESLACAEGFPGCVALGERWRGHLASGRWKLQEHLFWVQPSAMWEMPSDLFDELASKSALAFTKGDANYRRLLGDRSWALDAPFKQVCAYFPTTLCALRTLKAELGCGMRGEETARAAAQDASWMVNGRFGVIQVAPPFEA